MDKWMQQFCAKHCLSVNAEKTIVTGRNRDGSALGGVWQWPNLSKPFTILPPGTSFRYLGIMLNVNLEWKTQIDTCNATVMNIVSRLGCRQITLLQGALLVKNYLVPKLSTAFRHATIPTSTLAHWDSLIARSLCRRSDLLAANIHKSSVLTIIGCLGLEKHYLAERTLQLMSRIVEINNDSLDCELVRQFCASVTTIEMNGTSHAHILREVARIETSNSERIQAVPGSTSVASSANEQGLFSRLLRAPVKGIARHEAK